MKDNIVDFQRIRDSMNDHSTDVANDAVYSDKKKISRFFYLLTPVRYLLAASLYLVVVIPLGILAGFRFLLQFLGGIAVMGLISPGTWVQMSVVTLFLLHGSP